MMTATCPDRRVSLVGRSSASSSVVDPRVCVTPMAPPARAGPPAAVDSVRGARRHVHGDVAVVAGGAQRDDPRRRAVLRLVRDLGVAAVLLELGEEHLVLLLREPLFVLVVEAFDALVRVALDDTRRAAVARGDERDAVELREPRRQAGLSGERVARAGDGAFA